MNTALWVAKDVESCGWEKTVIIWTSRRLIRLGLCSPDCHCRKPPHQPVGSWLLVTQRAWEALCPCTCGYSVLCGLLLLITPLLICITDMDLFPLSESLSLTSLHKPQWLFMRSLSPLPSLWSFQADSHILVVLFPRKISPLWSEYSRALPSSVGLMWPVWGYFSTCFLTGEARKVTPPLPREGKRKARVSLDSYTCTHG